LPKALPYPRPSLLSIYIGNYAYILAFGVEEGSLVGRGYIFDWWEDCKGESDAEERGEVLPAFNTSFTAGILHQLIRGVQLDMDTRVLYYLSMVLASQEP
jgi:hypothetical protein